ncbi:MAG: tripartite tricarboxylate transporter substrate binding protein [Burkholderiales bacterium]|nr:tripartite tricarboxylate transporter substrate binding protein [Burkholderiales bacterium]
MPVPYIPGLRLALAAILSTAAVAQAAQVFPSKVIRMVVPLAPGGTGDTLARTVGEEMGRILGTNIVIDNRMGAGGLIGTQTVATAAPDGYTLINVSPSHVINPALHTRKTYDPVKDFEAVIHIANTYQIIVAHPSLPAKNLKELIALAKASPGKLSYGSAGTGSATHLNMELFKQMAGVDIVHVPYKGSTPSRIDTVAGQIQLSMDGLLPVLPFIKDGRLRPLGLTSSKRSQAAPDIPTIGESVPGYATDTWYGILAPAKTPKAIIATLHGAAAKAMNTPATAARLKQLGTDPVGGTSEQFGKLLASEAKLWAKVVKVSGAKVN